MLEPDLKRGEAPECSSLTKLCFLVFGSSSATCRRAYLKHQPPFHSCLCFSKSWDGTEEKQWRLVPYVPLTAFASKCQREPGTSKAVTDTLLQRNSMSGASNISYFQPIPSVAGTSATWISLTEARKGPTRFSWVSVLAQTPATSLCFRHWIWWLLKLQ